MRCRVLTVFFFPFKNKKIYIFGCFSFVVRQEHFETQEDAMIASAIKADRRDPKNKGDTKDGLKAEKGQDGHSSEADEGAEDGDDDGEGDIRDETGAAANVLPSSVCSETALFGPQCLFCSKSMPVI